MDELVKSYEARGRDLVGVFQKELSGFRTNRPASQLIEDIKVEYAGQFLPLKQVGSISIVPPREIQVNVWDIHVVHAVQKAIEVANIGLTPSAQGNMVRVMLPPMSDERREELKRLVKTVAEKFRIQLRALREETNKKIEAAAKVKEVSEDQKFRLRERVQKAIDTANKDIEQLIDRKFQEIEI